MEQQQELTALARQQPDPEVFRRVWDRVMPDQRDSPLVVATAAEVPAPSPAPEPSPTPVSAPAPPPALPPEEPLCLGEGSRGETETLKALMAQAQEGAAAGQLLVRRGGPGARAMAALAGDHRRAFRQLSAAYFLITGRRHRPAAPPLNLPASLPLALRDQFVREQKWERACLQAVRESEDACLRELYQELAQDGALHAGVIRSLLEQM